MTCGDTQAQWVNALLGSTWTGQVTDDGGPALAVVLVVANNLAVVTVDGVPLVGVWGFVNDSQISVVASTEGIEWAFQVSADACASGRVTQASGSARDPLLVGHPCTWTRVV